MLPEPPRAVAWIARTLEDAGFETWVVGGAIRDGLLDLPHEDWDLSTRARPTDVQRLFERTVPLGVDHGTVGVLSRDRTLYEVTTFRRDVETFGRRARVEFADDVNDDLARRDFTINAMAWHPFRRELRDPFGGLDDLDRRQLRTVGVARERFSEDYLRVLRALRFAGRYGLRIERSTWDALCDGVSRLTDLSAERVRDELLKVLSLDPAPSGALTLYRASGALGLLVPELATAAGSSPNGWGRRVLTVDALAAGRPALRLAALLDGLSTERAAAVLFRLRFSNAQVRTISEVVGALSHEPLDAGAEAIRRWLAAIGPSNLSPTVRIRIARRRVDTAMDAERPTEAGADMGGARPEAVGNAASDDAGAVPLEQLVRVARRELRSGAPLSVGALRIDGRDLIALGLRPGPAFGRLLDALLDRALADPSLNEPERLLALARDLATEDSGASAEKARDE